MYPLFIAVVILYIENYVTSLKKWQKILIDTILIFSAFPADWSCIAVMAILYLWTKRASFVQRMLWMLVWTAAYALVYFFFIDRIYGVLQLCTALSIPLLRLYNGRRGKLKGMKWLFYVYYPAHLVLVGVLRLILWGDIPLMIGG